MALSMSRSMKNGTDLIMNGQNSENTSITPKVHDGNVFYKTPAARSISGVFVAFAILITVHQARKLLSLFNRF